MARMLAAASIASWIAPALLLFLGGTARAAPSAATAPATRSAPADKRALDLFEQSARAYREGRFQDAVDKLLEARRLKAEPVLLYNLGRAYEALGKPEEAAEAYSSYLREEPAAVDKKAIEGRIGTLRAQAAELAAARNPSDPSPAPEPPARAAQTTTVAAQEPPPSTDLMTYAPWIITGVGVAAIGTGLVFGAVANGRHDAAVSEPSQLAAAEKQDEAETYARVSTVTIIAGVVVALAGAGWLVLRASTNVVPSAKAAAGASALRWTF
jgi:tetratricopeptide (TPR) repeat protein